MLTNKTIYLTDAEVQYNVEYTDINGRDCTADSRCRLAAAKI